MDIVGRPRLTRTPAGSHRLISCCTLRGLRYSNTGPQSRPETTVGRKAEKKKPNLEGSQDRRGLCVMGARRAKSRSMPASNRTSTGRTLRVPQTPIRCNSCKPRNPPRPSHRRCVTAVRQFILSGILPEREITRRRYALVTPVLLDLEAFFKLTGRHGPVAPKSVKSAPDNPLTICLWPAESALWKLVSRFSYP